MDRQRRAPRGGHHGEPWQALARSVLVEGKARTAPIRRPCGRSAIDSASARL